jgi:hypothetical protein
MNIIRELIIEKSLLYCNGVILRDKETRRTVFTGSKRNAIKWCLENNWWFKF